MSIISLLSEMIAAAALILVSLSLSAAGAAAPPAPAPMGMANCDTKCGDITVPYPFGMGSPHCYHSAPGFNLTCVDNNTAHPRLLMGNGDGTLQVESFDPSESYVLVMRIPGDAADSRGDGSLFGVGALGRYITLSAGLYGYVNEFILLGCNVRATLKSGNVTMSGCTSLCVDDGEKPWRHSRLGMLCTGMGCCRAPIFKDVPPGKKPAAAGTYHVQLEWFGRNRSADEDRMPAQVLVARDGWFEHKYDSLYRLSLQPQDIARGVPVRLDWELPADPSSQRINSSHRVCSSTEGTRGGYRCRCDSGYDGNPYIANGCQDINECELQGYLCSGDTVCINIDGGFDCRCPSGTQGYSTALPGVCGVPVVSVTDGKCNRFCGDMEVPYPFGIGVGPSDCYRPGFNLHCVSYPSSSKPPRLLLDNDRGGEFQVRDIFLHNNTLRVTGSIYIEGPNPNGAYVSSFIQDQYLTDRGDALYSLSTRNELAVMGCHVQATLLGRGHDRAILSGCATFCPYGPTEPIASNKNCDGIGCCQARISESTDGLPSEIFFKFANPNVVRIHENTTQPPFVLIAEEGWFDHRLLSEQQMQAFQRKHRFSPKAPIALQWEVLQSAGLPKADAKSHPNCHEKVAADICKSKHSQCKPGNRGYSCQCRENYHGNPYIHNGCKGGSPGGLMSIKGIRIGVIGVTCVASLVLLVLMSFFVSKKLRNHRAQMLRRKFFEQNRGQLLQQLVSHRAGIAERMIITLEELVKATRNFDKVLEVGTGGHGTVYKGILSNQQIVAIKKPKKVVKKEIDDFINEVAILSQINHRNVVKLYGCCLETEVPMLVYEFISNGTLDKHLHVEGPKSLPWDDRLRIATETAKSLAYLHSTASIPIIHRDVKSANILLDDTLTAKVADFGASRYFPLDKSGVTTMAQGTRGYWDPMYFYTGRLTEKSDVYSFGVVLVELLTRKKPFSYLSSEGEGLVEHFVTLFTESNLIQILDPQVMEEGGREVEEVAAIAVACIKLRGEDRPTMRQVELTLESYRASKEHILGNALPKKVENNDVTIYRSSTNVRRGRKKSTRCYSMEEEFMLSASYPR